MKVHVEGGIKVRPLDLLCMTENTVGIFDDIIDDIMLDEGYRNRVAPSPSLLTADALHIAMHRLGIRADKVWYVTEIDEGLLASLVEKLGVSDVSDGNMGHLIINYVTSMLTTGKWCNPVY